VQSNISYRPRVSRETRLLLTAGALAVAALWLLARFRFQDLPATPNPLPAVLSQLPSVPKYDDLADEIAQLQPRLDALIIVLDSSPETGRALQPALRVAALRVREDAALALLPPKAGVDGTRVLVRDPASFLAIVSAPNAPTVTPVAWVPRRLRQPRYFIASDLSAGVVSWRPVFVGSLNPVESPLWSEAAWALPASSDLAPGSFLFTTDAELVGMVIARDGERSLVPGATLLAESASLLAIAPAPAPAGTLDVEVQSLTEPVALATGASTGVVVTWVEPGSTAAGRLTVGDVIEGIDGQPIVTRQQWDVRVARLSADETLTLRVRREGESRDVVVIAGSPTDLPVVVSLGLTLRARRGIGAEVVAVASRSAGERAGLESGDLITLVAARPEPTPAQVTQAFRALSEGERLIIAVTRGRAHFVTTLDR
jgi:CBS domain-containing protein